MKNNIIDFQSLTKSDENTVIEQALKHVLKKTQKSLPKKKVKEVCALTALHFQNESPLEEQVIRNFFFTFLSEKMNDEDNITSLNSIEKDILVLLNNASISLPARKKTIFIALVIAIAATLFIAPHQEPKNITATADLAPQLTTSQIKSLKKHVDNIVLLHAKYKSEIISRHRIWNDVKNHISQHTNGKKIRSYKNIPPEHFKLAETFLISWQEGIKKNR